MEGPDDHESLEVVGAKLKAVAKVNHEILDAIEASKHKLVVSKYNYSLKCELSGQDATATAGQEATGSKTPWSFVATPQREGVATRVDRWRYTGEPLEAVEDIFNDNIIYRMNDHEDVTRLNKDLLRVGTKFCDLLADRPKPRSGARVFLRNLERVHVAVGELNNLVIDAKDEASGSEALEEGMKQIVSGFQKVKEEVGIATLKLRSGFQILAQFTFKDLNIPIDWLGKSLLLEAEPYHKVIDIRKMIQEKEGVALDRHRVSFDGKYLEDDRTLESYGISSESTIKVWYIAPEVQKKSSHSSTRKRRRRSSNW
uniref:Ubiquitin-like domain-containing protein n=1 Tax=Odontella aurita TaxID=265563 RepID=A0A7S4KB10_9STRA|mmetsp:Transcript_7823/g.23040  ORF Transcript_7823/g.23040 Transcript_7823/m.23040 type:complete len:313 (+) Transcript_7823:314-1252(+)